MDGHLSEAGHGAAPNEDELAQDGRPDPAPQAPYAAEELSGIAAAWLAAP